MTTTMLVPPGIPPEKWMDNPALTIATAVRRRASAGEYFESTYDDYMASVRRRLDSDFCDDDAIAVTALALYEWAIAHPRETKSAIAAGLGYM